MPFALPFDYVVVMTGWLLALGVSLLVLVWLARRWSGAAGARRLGLRIGLAAWTLSAALTGAELAVAIGFDETDSFNCTNVSKHWWSRHVQPDLKSLSFRDGQSIEYRDRRALPAALADGQELVCV
ncbi:MAG TPA: hypothetical protein VFD43_03500, partial [Planctomycetota bacterium]|nr:hypothetical protein [Planctomycetota bacterium]